MLINPVVFNLATCSAKDIVVLVGKFYASFNPPLLPSTYSSLSDSSARFERTLNRRFFFYINSSIYFLKISLILSIILISGH